MMGSFVRCAGARSASCPASVRSASMYWLVPHILPRLLCQWHRYRLLSRGAGSALDVIVRAILNAPRVERIIATIARNFLGVHLGSALAARLDKLVFSLAWSWVGEVMTNGMNQFDIREIINLGRIVFFTVIERW